MGTKNYFTYYPSPKAWTRGGEGTRAENLLFMFL
jgi:hypothetical protein